MSGYVCPICHTSHETTACPTYHFTAPDMISVPRGEWEAMKRRVEEAEATLKQVLDASVPYGKFFEIKERAESAEAHAASLEMLCKEYALGIFDGKGKRLAERVEALEAAMREIVPKEQS